jgi:hypothetical protein
MDLKRIFYSFLIVHCPGSMPLNFSAFLNVAPTWLIGGMSIFFPAKSSAIVNSRARDWYGLG